MVRFDVALRELAIELARTVIANELSRRIPPNRRRRPAVTRPKVRAKRGMNEAPATAAPASVEPPLETTNDRSSVATTELLIPEAMPAQDSPRRRWTREQVVSELGAWLLAGQPVEAAFVKRHGPKGLVAAATKFFGRFDAALNTANLAIAGRVDAQRKAKRSKSHETLPSLRELARRQQRRRTAAGAM